MKKKLLNLKADQARIFERSAAVLGALASPVRLQLLHFLSQAPLSVEVLSSKVEQSVANTSMHLRKLQAVNILKVEVKGQKRVYSFSHPGLYRFWEELQDFSQNVDPKLFLTTHEIYGEIDWNHDLDFLRKEIKSGKAVLLDVRPEDEAGEAQLEGLKSYLHIPESQLKQHLNKIPKKKNVLVFCRGRHCALSAHAVDFLRKNGVNAYRLKHSWFALNKLVTREAV